MIERRLWLAALIVVLLPWGCGGTGHDPSAAFAGTVGKACGSAHDCAVNQRCEAQRCVLDANACVRHQDCGSRLCQAGYCALPSPALMSEARTRATDRLTHMNYLAAGNDGLVDARGGLVLNLLPQLSVVKEQVRWGGYYLDGWRASGRSPGEWRVSQTDPNLSPERFTFFRPDGAVLFAYVRPLMAQSHSERSAALRVLAEPVLQAMGRGRPVEDAVTQAPGGPGESPVEALEFRMERISALPALLVEGRRQRLEGWSERFGFYVGRLDFGGIHYALWLGYSAPEAKVHEVIADFEVLVRAVRLAGVAAAVESGL